VSQKGQEDDSECQPHVGGALSAERWDSFTFVLLM
jgi:hypothetical protein